MNARTMPSTGTVSLRDCTALTDLGSFLAARHYRFTTVTPDTHARILRAHPGHLAGSLRDIFGWNRPFTSADLPTDLLDRLLRSGLVRHEGMHLRSQVRYASIGDRLYAHDGFPTTAEDAVFFGPDTYRFVAALERHLRPCGILADIGCGSGAGGLEAARTQAARVVLTDINARALDFAVSNALLNRQRSVSFHQGDLLKGFEGHLDAIISNPPYLLDGSERLYRNGGGHLGLGLALRILREAIDRLRPGGQLILYTGSPVVDGIDQFAAAALPLAHGVRATVRYEEVDPDVFGQELDLPTYATVERIAAVVLSLTMSTRPLPRRPHS